MILFSNRVDNRQTLGTYYEGGCVWAVQYDEDFNGFVDVKIEDTEYNDREVGNVVIDATEDTRIKLKLHSNIIELGDEILISSGRKMLNQTKVVKSEYTYNTGYGQSVDYYVFTDNTKVQCIHCKIKGYNFLENSTTRGGKRV